MLVLGDRTYYAIYSMRCPQHVMLRGANMRSVWNDGVKVSRLSINQFKLLGLQDGLFLGLGTFGGNVLGYRW